MATSAWRLALIGTLAAAGAAWAEPIAVPLRTGDHDGFGRVVLDLPAGCTPSVREEADRVTVSLSGACRIAGLPRPPRNVASLDAVAGELGIRKAQGVTLRRMTLGNRLVLDFPDRPADRPSDRPTDRRAQSTPPRTAPQPSPRGALQAAPGVSPERLAALIGAHDRREARAGTAPSAAPPPDAPIATAPVVPVSTAPSPSVASAAVEPARRAAVPAGLPRASFLFPGDAEVGAAAFRRNGAGVVVFDTARPLDIAAISAALGRPVFQPAGPTTATVVEVPLRAGEALQARRRGDGWLVTILASGAPAEGVAIPADVRPEGTLFRLDTPGRVVELADADTGSRALVGTVRTTVALVPQERRLPDYAADRTWLGIVIRPAAATVEMQAVRAGFALRGATPPGALTEVGAASGYVPQSRLFDFPPSPTEALWRRLQAFRASADASTGAARADARVRAAEAMLALGLGAEAQAALDAITEEAVHLASDPRVAGLRAVAAVLSGRAGEGAPVDIPGPIANDEASLWRALSATAAQKAVPGAAQAIAGNVDLITAYPEELRRKVLPQAVTALIAGGESDAARRLLDRFPEQPGADIARAQLLLREPDPTRVSEGVALLQKVASQGDRMSRSRAVDLLTERRLADGAIKPADAAMALSSALYAWRGDSTEYERRLRIAELQDMSGQGRAALAMLRETLEMWPDRRDAIQTRLATVFAHAMTADPAGSGGSVDWLSLVEENTDLWPQGERGAELGTRMAEQLLRLDLPKQAAAALQRAVSAAPPGPMRAQAGAMLAAIQGRSGDHAGVLETLNLSAASGLDATLAEERDILFARSAAALGDIGSARATLTRLGTDRALDEGAGLLEAAKDWDGAADMLGKLIARRDDGAAPLSREASILVLRLAGAVSRSPESALAEALRRRFLNRLADDKMNGTFDFLTATPVAAVSDLGRAATESRLAKAMPAAIKGLGATTPRM